MSKNRAVMWTWMVGGLCAVALGSCDRTAPAPEAVALTASPPPGDTASPNPSAALPPESARPAAPFTGGAQVFRSVMETLRAKYYRAGLTEDELYRAAVAGMLQHIEPQMAPWNKLLPPEEMHELTADLTGEIVGIGVEIKFDPDSGISDVLSLIPGSPARSATCASPSSPKALPPPCRLRCRSSWASTSRL